MNLSLPVTAPAPAHSRPVRAIDELSSPQNIALGEVSGSQDKTIGRGQKPPTASPLNPGSDAYKATIYGTNTATPPTASYTINEREQRIDAYANRVKTQLGNIESGNEGERNVKFQSARQFMEPSGYFSGGLLAAGYDPHEKITVTFTSYVGKGKPENLTGTEKRTYFAWEIAAGALAHDKVERGGPLNFQFMEIESQDRTKVNDLESVGKKLQDHWELEIATPMRDASGTLARRSGKADAYVLKGTLQSLSHDRDSFEKLSPNAQESIKRTLEQNGQVIIPNLYGYPLSGYAFIPYVPYDGKYENRPNQGLMIDLKNGTAREIHGDKDFVDWAKANRDNLQLSFNASDRQGSQDAHWPKAGEVLDSLIADNHATYPGYQNFFKDQAIPIREMFNYTRARAGDYRLKYGNLDKIASKYQAQNAKNAVWADQTEVFGSSQQSWKNAKDFWGNTFGYVPIIGNAGNIVFGVHDGIYGKTAEDRLGGNAAVVISALQLAHEVAPIAAEVGLGEPHIVLNSPAAKDYSWKYNSQTSDFELVRSPKAANDSDIVSVTNNKVPEPPPEVNPLRPSQAGHIRQHAVPNGEQLIENATRNTKGIYQVKDATTGADQWYIRYTDATGVRQVYEIKGNFKLSNDYVQIIDRDTGKPVMTVHATGDGEWARGIGPGGIRRWFWERTPSPTPSQEPKLPTKLSDAFLDLDGTKLKGAEKIDEYLQMDSNVEYEFSRRNIEEDGVIKSKIGASWTLSEDRFDIEPAEKAGPSSAGSSEYSPSFVKDIHRFDYTVVVKEGGAETRTALKSTAGSAEGKMEERLSQFETLIPDPKLRARISEVAHQGSLAPATTYMNLPSTGLQDGYYLGGGDTQITIEYDATAKQAKVIFESKNPISNPDQDLSKVPGVEITTKRTFTITESNEIQDSENVFVIDKHAPSQMELTVVVP